MLKKVILEFILVLLISIIISELFSYFNLNIRSLEFYFISGSLVFLSLLVIEKKFKKG